MAKGDGPSTEHSAPHPGDAEIHGGGLAAGSIDGTVTASTEHSPPLSVDGKLHGGGRMGGFVDRTVAKVDGASTEPTADKSSELGTGHGNHGSRGGLPQDGEEGGVKSRDESSDTGDSARSPGADGVLLHAGDLSFSIRGPDTPAKLKLKKQLQEMGGVMVSPVICNQCPHSCFQSSNVPAAKLEGEDRSPIENFSGTCSEKNQCVSRELSFGLVAGQLEKQEEEELKRKNHHLFLCSEDYSSYMTLYAYSVSNRNEMTLKVKTPGSYVEHNSRTTLGDVKESIKEAYILLKSLHGVGYSLEGKFDITNFITAQVKGRIDMRLDIPLGILRRSTLKGEGLDLKQLTYVMRRQLFITAPIPHDMNYWLTLASKDELEDLLPFHIAILEDQPALGLFMSMYDKLIKLRTENGEEFKEIVTALEEYSKWQDDLSQDDWSNKYLEGTKSFVRRFSCNNDTNYPEDAYGLLKLLWDCKNHQGQKLLENFLLVVAQEYPNLLYHFQEVKFRRGHFRPRRLELRKVSKPTE